MIKTSKQKGRRVTTQALADAVSTLRSDGLPWNEVTQRFAEMFSAEQAPAFHASPRKLNYLMAIRARHELRELRNAQRASS